jgi:hypothetical protein
MVDRCLHVDVDSDPLSLLRGRGRGWLAAAHTDRAETARGGRLGASPTGKGLGMRGDAPSLTPDAVTETSAVNGEYTGM